VRILGDTVRMDRSQAADRELVRLLEEQEALRRVATLVARGTDRLGLFSAVTEEVGRLLGAELANMIRFEDGHGTIVGGWSGGPTPEAPVGYRISMAQDSLAARVRRTGRPARVDTYHQQGEVFTALRELGIRASVGAPVVVDGELWGAVLVGTTGADPFPPGAEEHLAGFAELVAQALANAEAREQLAASRKRLVEAAQVERRRLERNLHDGAQQRLVALALSLRLAERQVERDPAAARDLLAGASAELAEALEDLRELARGLHPAEALDAAAYFVVSEALTNVARYAFARTAAVTVRREGDSVLVEVIDDGDGGADPAAGSGLRGLMDRVEALGGRLDVESPLGRGTAVRAVLPER
jgi:signal transduction histidine kinase